MFPLEQTTSFPTAMCKIQAQANSCMSFIFTCTYLSRYLFYKLYLVLFFPAFPMLLMYSDCTLSSYNYMYTNCQLLRHILVSPESILWWLEEQHKEGICKRKSPIPTVVTWHICQAGHHNWCHSPSTDNSSFKWQVCFWGCDGHCWPFPCNSHMRLTSHISNEINYFYFQNL